MREKMTIKEIETWQTFLRNGHTLKNRTIQEIDFTKIQPNWSTLKVEGALFLGCKMSTKDQIYLIEHGATVMNRPEGLPYSPYRKDLYSWQELLDGDDPSQDLAIYEHFALHKHNTSVNEALWQRIHDHAIDDALREYIRMGDDGTSEEKCVGIMGGHQTRRDEECYLKVAIVSKLLTESGYLVVSGGGPGIMEAANLGAYMAFHSDNSLTDVIQHLRSAPHYTSPNYTKLALEVWENYRNNNRSLAVPTWFYGHEPSNVFSPGIAKYFSNSIREDTLLAICLHGVIYAPGSAGTTQEVFMDAAQNHYGTYGFYSPMIFLGQDHYEFDTTIYPLVKRLARGRAYQPLLALSDSPNEIVDFIRTHPPIKA